MNARIEKRIDYVKNMTNDAYFYERMTLLEQAYTLYQDEETGRRYADAFYYVLKHMALLILDDELIVGSVKEIIPTAEQQALYDKVISRPGNQNDMQWGNSFDSLLLQKARNGSSAMRPNGSSPTAITPNRGRCCCKRASAASARSCRSVWSTTT